MRVDETAEVLAAGAVLWRPAPAGRDGEVEVALVHRPRYDDWSLPKGKLDPDESLPAAAVREVAEETGSHAVLGVQLGTSHYRVDNSDKVVHYWTARATSGEFTPNTEVDQLDWLPPSAAEDRLSYPRDREILRRFRAFGPPPRPLLLVRHAKAGRRDKWVGDDDLRPLTAAGRAQAHALDELLGLFGPERAYAAPPLRCPLTLEPLADRLGLTIHPEPLLSEQGYWRDPEAGLARFLELAAAPGVPVICSQGGVIPDLITRLTGNPEPPAAKGSTWVLGFPASPQDQGNTRALTADYYPAPR